MDDLDSKILEELKNDSRQTFVEIAEKLRTSEGTVRNRVKKLVTDGTIERFTIKTARKNIKAILEVSCDINVNTMEISDEMMKIPGVESIYEVSGDVDIVVMVNVASTEDLNNIIESIREIEHTRSTKTRLILREL